MIIGILKAQSVKEAEVQLARISGCDGIELRLDYCEHFNRQELEAFRQKCAWPLIFTLRNRESGGHFVGTESERMVLLAQLAACSPDYLDIEHTVPVTFIEDLKNRYPALNILRSYHNLNETPNDLDAILHEMLHPAISVYKLATQANSGLDGLRVLNFMQACSGKHPVVGVGMGSVAQFTRILSPLVGGLWTYANISENDEFCDTGLLSVNELRTIYHFHDLNKKTALFGVVGDPVEQSRGPLYHNAQFRRMGIDAVYVKLPCQKHELSDFFQLIKCLDVKGLSVTMPLKEAVQPFVTDVADIVKDIGVMNTLIFQEKRITAFNTDGPASLDVLRSYGPIEGENVLIIGAGGVAKAIAYSLGKAGAKVSLINRTETRVKDFSKKWSFELLFEENIKTCPVDFSYVINAIPDVKSTEKYTQNILKYCLTPSVVAMDCVYSHSETFFINCAKKIGSRVICGTELFEAQAVRQSEIWRDFMSLSLLKDSQA